MMGSADRTSNRDNGFVERERRADGGRTPWPPGSRPTATGHGRCAWQWSTGGARGRDTSKKGGGIACDCHGSNGGRARCPHRAARVMRVCNGEGGKGAGGRRGAHGTRDVKPRTAVGSPHGRRRSGAMGTSHPTATMHAKFARPLGTRGAHGHYACGVRMCITHAGCACALRGRRGAVVRRSDTDGRNEGDYKMENMSTLSYCHEFSKC